MARSNKGVRHTVTVRPPREHHETFKAAAARWGMDLGPYLCWVLQRAHGLDPTEKPSTEAQLALHEGDGSKAEQALAS